MRTSHDLPMARARSGAARIASSSLTVAVALLLVGVLPGPVAAQFVEWDSFSVTGPFSVTAVMRGLNGVLLEGPPPMVRLETLVGFNAGAGNRFEYHSSEPLSAPASGPVSRRVDTRGPVDFTNAGIQTSLNGLCCSNFGKGIDDDSSLHYLTDFSTTSSFEVLIGTPEVGVVELREQARLPLGDDDDVSPDDDDHDSDSDDDDDEQSSVQGVVGFRRIMATSAFPGAGINIYSNAGAGGGFVLETTLADCRGVNTNWHYSRSGSDTLEESFVSCVTTSNNFVIKRVSHVNFSTQQIVLNSGLPANSSIFTYLQSASCPLGSGFVIGTMEPRADLGTTNFHAVFLNPGGTLIGTSSVVLPGARANRQAFTCTAAGFPDAQFATFVYHGAGATVGTTDTFVIQTNAASTSVALGGGEPMLVSQTTENRRTDWAAAFPTVVRRTTGGIYFHTFVGLRPVAELDFGSPSEVRYGGIQVPMFMDDFESGDLRYWSNVAQ